MKNLVYIFIIAFFSISCERIIDVDLKDSEPQFVIDAYTYDSLAFSKVRLSYSSNFYEMGDYQLIEDAEVKIYDEQNNEYLFTHVDSGLYVNSSFKLDNLTRYHLQVNHADDAYDAYSTCPLEVKIDSIHFEENFFQPEDKGEVFRVNVFFQDTVSVKNYYRLRIKINDVYQDGFFIFDDQFFDGNTIEYNFNSIELVENDDVSVELMGIDKNNYDYFLSLIRTSSPGGNGSTPGNPPSNIEGGAIGIFGAYSLDVFTEVFSKDKVKENGF
jgi:hypothetical protein